VVVPTTAAIHAKDAHTRQWPLPWTRTIITSAGRGAAPVRRGTAPSAVPPTTVRAERDPPLRGNRVRPAPRRSYPDTVVSSDEGRPHCARSGGLRPSSDGAGRGAWRRWDRPL